MTKGFYQHYSPEDHVFIDRVLELVARVEQQYSFELTSFLNPHQVDILRQIGAHHGLQVFSSAEIYRICTSDSCSQLLSVRGI